MADTAAQAVDELVAKAFEVKAERDRFRNALVEVEEIADDRADVDDGTPNDWMRVLVIVRTALGRRV